MYQTVNANSTHRKPLKKNSKYKNIRNMIYFFSEICSNLLISNLYGSYTLFIFILHIYLPTYSVCVSIYSTLCMANKTLAAVFECPVFFVRFFESSLAYMNRCAARRRVICISTTNINFKVAHQYNVFVCIKIQHNEF